MKKLLVLFTLVFTTSCHFPSYLDTFVVVQAYKTAGATKYCYLLQDADSDCVKIYSDSLYTIGQVLKLKP